MTEEQAAAMLSKLDEINAQLYDMNNYKLTPMMGSMNLWEGVFYPQVREMASVGCGLLFALLLALGLDRLFPR